MFKDTCIYIFALVHYVELVTNDTGTAALLICPCDKIDRQIITCLSVTCLWKICPLTPMYIMVSLFSHVSDKETIHSYGSDNRDTQFKNKESH